MLFHWFLVLITVTWMVQSREYYIKDQYIPSYLYYKNDTTEDVFPEDITVNISMSKVTGIFMYSFGKNTNQLIVTLRDGLPHVMDIELNTQRISISLPSICGCDRCRYEALALRIQLGYYIRVQCNGGEVQMFKNERNTSFNENYPIISTSVKRSADSESNHMWLVNTAQYDNIYPNNNQLYGCIFDVSYNDKSIQFTEVTPNIENKCIKTCTDNICNGGQCYETYSGAPICNCTSTFRNGPFCNDSIGSYNLQTRGRLLQFEHIKLSWNSSVNNIFELKNNNTSIWLEVQGSSLVFSYRSSKTQSNVELSNNYTKNKEYICIVYIRQRHLDILLTNNGSWSSEIMPVKVDLSREIFESVLLRSEDGYMDMVYKDNEEYKWRRLEIYEYTDYPFVKTNKMGADVIRDTMSSITARIRAETKTPEWMIVSFVVIALLVIAVGVSLYFWRHKRTFP